MKKSPQAISKKNKHRFMVFLLSDLE